MPNSVLIVVQNLKIGGYQRIALDELYGFAKEQYPVELVSLEDFTKSIHNNLFYLEKDLIEKFNLSIKVADGHRYQQLTFFKRYILSCDNNLVIFSHSLRATVLIRIASFACKKNVRIHTVIHQIPSLSDPIQRLKRFLYSLFSNSLHTFSVAAKNDWDEKINDNLLLKFMFKNKPISLLRNGVFLERLPVLNQINTLDAKSNFRLIFLGRPTRWKGAETLLNLSKLQSLVSFEIVFFFPYENLDLFSDLPESIRDRITVNIGKTISSYSPRSGDIHLYPTNYGQESKFIESVSINCLEMSAVGVPSCVTLGGLATWPELSITSLIVEVDWSNLKEVSNKILETHGKKISVFDLKKVREVVDIKHHVNQMIQIINQS
jgi:hypothetical protein